MRIPVRLPWAILLATGALAVTQAALTLLFLHYERAQALDDSGRTVLRALAGAEANINRTLLQVDALLSGLQQIVPIRPDDAEAVATANRSLRLLSDQSFMMRELLIARPDGTVIASGLPATQRRPPALPERLGLPPGSAPPAVLTVGDPARNRLTGEWSLFAGRGVRFGTGESLLAAAELPLPNLAKLVLPDTAADTLRVTLERADGRLLMSSPHDPLRTGERLNPIPPRPGSTSGWALVPDRFGSGSTVAAASGSLYPGLVVVAQMTEEDALAGWRGTVATSLSLSAGVALILLAAGFAGALAVRARERATAEVRQSKRLLDQALDSMSEGFALFDADRRLVVANRRYGELFPHLSGALVPGTAFAALAERSAAAALPHADEAARQDWVAWRLDSQRRGGIIEQTFPGGVVVEGTQADIPGGGFVCVHRDVTLAKQAEARLAQARDAAEQANRFRSEFLSNMSHELRTPLNAIIGFAQVLEQGDAGQTEAMRIEYARDIHTSGEHLLAIINDVLDMSKIEAGAMGLRESDCDLGRVVHGALGMLREQARSNDVEIRTAPAEAPLFCRADERLLRQVILNLAANAIKFTEAGGTVTVNAAEVESGDIHIIVGDTGIGMAPEHLPRIFEPFYQAEGGASRRRGGTGLGLSISLAIMRLHQGTLEVASTPGCGTVVRAILPAERRLRMPWIVVSQSDGAAAPR